MTDSQPMVAKDRIPGSPNKGHAARVRFSVNP